MGIPNVAYAVVEGPARRRVKGLRSNSLNLAPSSRRGLDSLPVQFLIRPGVIDFGTVHHGQLSKIQLSLTNVSVEIGRFKVRQPKSAALRVVYTPGPVMAGMTCKMTVELTAQSAFEDELEIISEAQVFRIPMRALVAGAAEDDQATAVDRPAQSAAARVADNEPATKVGKKAASLRAEVDQAGAAMSITGDVDLTEGHNVPKPRVPSEVEWVAKDVESLSLDELKAMETRDA